jgi:hypothetical protein
MLAVQVDVGEPGRGHDEPGDLRLPRTGGKVVWCALALAGSPFGAADGETGPALALPGRRPAAVPASTAPVEAADDLDLLRRVVAGLRALDGWHRPAEAAGSPDGPQPS